ncbi:MAG TPA: NAD(P)H-hydrate epimerase, partial [Kiloniellaceae bacterium]|nr:NAD(P)H-hydrate epimerase [Kiloniellaceae bacterium]
MRSGRQRRRGGCSAASRHRSARRPISIGRGTIWFWPISMFFCCARVPSPGLPRSKTPQRRLRGAVGPDMTLPGQDAAAGDSPWEPAEVLTVQEMYEADRLAIAEIGGGYPLMERAGAGVATRVLARRNETGDGPVAVLCGPGNNGGDGFVAARHLQAAGVPVRLALLGSKDRLSGDAATAAAAWEGGIEPLEETSLDGAAQVVDALFGAGLDRPLTGVPAQLAAVARDASLPVFAVDVPSGIAGDKAQPLGDAVFQALETITFYRKKPAHLLAPS